MISYKGKEEVEMIYGDNDIHYLESIINKAIEILGEWTIYETSACTDKIISETLELLKKLKKHNAYASQLENEIILYKLEIERLNKINKNLEEELSRVYEIELDYPKEFVEE